MPNPKFLLNVKKGLASLFFTMFLCTRIMAVDISGKVADKSGRPLSGVSVSVKNGGMGTFTDTSGRFSVDADRGDMLVFSYMGYQTREFPVDGRRTVINVVLSESGYMLDNVVVVAYGTAKKSNLTDAVAQVDGSIYENKPVTGLAGALEGQIANLNIKPFDGKPGRSPEFNIRGTTSIGAGGSALVLIDGVEGDPSMVNPNDIKSISVLKDASSAAIYGARGAFGVVLVTTKDPVPGRCRVKYSGSVSLSRRAVIPSLVTDGYEWADMFERAHVAWYGTEPTAINSAFPFSGEYLAELKRRHDDPSLSETAVDNRGNYVYYASHNWMKDLYKDFNWSDEHNLSVSGGSDKAVYAISGRFSGNDGIYRYNTDDYKMYNFTAKGKINVNGWLEVHDNLRFSRMRYKEPLYYGGWSYNSEISMGFSMRSFPVSPMLNEDGTLTEMGARSVGDFYYGKNKAVTKDFDLTNSVGADASFFDGRFTVSGDFSYNYKTHKKTRAYSAVPYSGAPEAVSWVGSQSKLFNDSYDVNYISSNLYLKYAESYRRNHVKALAGFNYEDYGLDGLTASRTGILDPDNPGFSLSDGQVYETKDYVRDWAVKGVFARINYDYDKKYFLELNGRYDGASKFPRRQRFGFFPSASASWKVSEENFWRNIRNTVNRFKLRISCGTLGNSEIEPYLYQSLMSVGKSGRLINGDYPSYTSSPNVVPDGLTWENVTTADIGADLCFFRNRLSVSADIYRRKTSNMFTTGPTLPDVFGDDPPKGNYADLKTRGWELTVEWHDALQLSKPLNYRIRVILSDNQAKITRYNNPDKNLDDYYEGMTVGEIWGYVTEGLFKDQNDIDNHAKQIKIISNASGVAMPGDIKFRDIDCSGYIDYGSNRVGDSGDRKIIGNSSPRYAFGVNLDLDYGGFFCNMFFQGIGKRDWYPAGESYFFWGQYNRPYNPIPKCMLGKIYDADPGNPDPDAYFPRYSGETALSKKGSLYNVQTRYLQNAAYIRLKNLTVGYDIPSRWLEKAGLEKASIYFTGQNLWTYSPMFKVNDNIDPESISNIDPETGNSTFGNGNGYPIMKIFTIGVNITF